MRGPALDATPRYLKHPPAASGWWPDGAPLDSGTAAMLHSNCSVLAYQNCREIGHTLAPGYVTSYVTDWASVIDASPDLTAGVFGSIAWHQDYNAVVVGPYVPSFTRLQTSPPGMVPRPVRVVVQVEKHGGGTGTQYLTIMAALVSGDGTPLRSTPIATAQVSLDDLGAPTATLEVSLILNPLRPLAPSTSWRSRPDTALAASTPVTPCYVWVGWYSTDTADAVWSVSAFEVPE